ncbi:hypothetical protein Ahy_B08g094033 isoform A [Arachis hypogaea]|uniref:Uncharacterized protein n=1 Tax=Arachis hypogaea TaxID=3818 RepID=A0A444Y7N0_ARAHY|nr:hypothetical protein Ahy_B08g094033 isoform A [Arachis hypogaea]
MESSSSKKRTHGADCLALSKISLTLASLSPNHIYFSINSFIFQVNDIHLLSNALQSSFSAKGSKMIQYRRGNSKSRVKKNPPTKLISENAASGYTTKLQSDARYVSQTMKFGSVGLPPYRAYSLEEIEVATNNFDSARFMGEGSQGQLCLDPGCC